jgi:hypothetical protein
MEKATGRSHHGEGIMGEALCRRHHGGGIREEASWRRHYGGGIMEKKSITENILEASGRHLGSIHLRFSPLV